MAAYSLARACWIVGKVDNAHGRRDVFSDVIKKSFKIRFSYAIYEKSPINLKSLLILIYGLKCYLSLDCRKRKNVDITFFASYPNERDVLDNIRRRLRGFRLGRVTISKRNFVRWDALRALPAYVGLAVRSARIAGMLARRFPFMPACRVFSTLTYYARCRRMLAGNDTRAVFIANHYSPECLALAAAAHQSGKKVIFTNHANATRDSGFVAPLYSDLAALTSQALLDMFLRDHQRNLNAVFVPVSSPQRAMRRRFDPSASVTVGIFLTALTDLARLRDVAAELAGIPTVAAVLIRPHPVAVVGEDLSSICAPGGRVRDTGGTPLSDNIADCDIAVCGNSTVVIEILRGGVPVLYDGRLDRIPHDYNGYVKRGLIPQLAGRWDDAVLEKLAEFYGDPAWVKTMRNFDAGYQRDEGAMFRTLDAAVREVIR